MKRLVILSALLASTGIVAKQTPLTVNSKEPFKGANIIVIQAPDSASVALQKFARVLVEQGFSVDKLDLKIGYLTTAPRPYGQISPAEYTYRAVVSPSTTGSTLAVTGSYTVVVGLRKMSEDMFWAKGNLTQGKQCFTTIEKATKAYPSGSILYSKKD
ncbi:hypothetical protein [Hymenobacter fodinae]|uniref:Uncharacterized protein n=1 Tax=Hymenobacter fodinae TaxID=2510796 RepID=A0A4Z0P2H0_9BACT|nr:hypothetical protein [Hymenobacter fodinae]TGE05553.1 hypothetical protein EU556_19835 [Hymenobacter fodinae]